VYMVEISNVAMLLHDEGVIDCMYNPPLIITTPLLANGSAALLSPVIKYMFISWQDPADITVCKETCIFCNG
jgi:hypothetical protein